VATIDISTHRLQNQRISRPVSAAPTEAVRALGALQAQEHTDALWAVGLRCSGATKAEVEQEIAGAAIIRTWLMRGTLHMAAAADVGWMLDLLSSRLVARSARRYRQLELDEETFHRSFDVFVELLRDGEALTRDEMMVALRKAGVSSAGQRGYHILRRAGLAGLICFGPMRNGEQTFVLLKDWAPDHKSMDRDTSLAELARRYFAGHGPATLRDFVWWSGLLVRDAKVGVETAKTELYRATVGDQEYWMSSAEDIVQDPPHTAYLLPAYDEYYIGYRQRDAVLNPHCDADAVSSHGYFRPMIVIDGQIVGTWTSYVDKDSVTIELDACEVLTDARQKAVELAATRYGAFRNLRSVIA
jgi:hypothetical protein